MDSQVLKEEHDYKREHSEVTVKKRISKPPASIFCGLCGVRSLLGKAATLSVIEMRRVWLQTEEQKTESGRPICSDQDLEEAVSMHVCFVSHMKENHGKLQTVQSN